MNKQRGWVKAAHSKPCMDRPVIEEKKRTLTQISIYHSSRKRALNTHRFPERERERETKAPDGKRVYKEEGEGWS